MKSAVPLFAVCKGKWIMENLQRLVFKIISIIFLGFFPLTLSAQPVEIIESLDIADSLFEQQKYTESFRIYEAIFEQGEMVSPSMLLKMAYIKEGLEEVSEAMYFLNIYYLKTSNSKVQEKIRQLAEDHQLVGYDRNGFDVMIGFLHLYYVQVIIACALLSLLLFAFIVFAKLKLRKKAYGSGISFVMVTALLFYLMNFDPPGQLGIVCEHNVYLMSGPSSGSDVISIIEPGHKVKITGKQDVWLEIEWDNQIAYTKQKNIKPLSAL